MHVICGVCSESVSHLFLHCSATVSLSLFGIFDECWVCPSSLDQFLGLASMVLRGEKMLNFYGNVKSMLQSLLYL